jgi:hypothetical protein
MTVRQANGVRFGRLERRGLLAGLSGAQVGLLGAALVTTVAAQVAAGPAGIVLAAPVSASATALALLPLGGRPAVEALPDAGGWLVRRGLGGAWTTATLLPATETLVIPGVPGRLRVVSSGTGAAVISRRPARGRSGRLGPVTLVAAVRGRGFVLHDADTQDRRVNGWARLLTTVGQLEGVSGAQVLHRTVPGGGTADLQAWWNDQVRGRNAFATQVVAELVDTAAPTRLEALLAVTVELRALDEIEGVCATIETALAGAELDLTGWLTVRQLGQVIREAYDPDGAARSGVDGAALLGPMAVTEEWTHLRTDTGFHATYWISEWPRTETHPGFLQPLLLAPGAHRALTILARPLSPARALREIRRARAEQIADATARARTGRVEEETARAASAELNRREQDLVAGHGDLRFVGLLAVTATTLDELAEACRATETAAAQAGCELRRLSGQQVAAYAAAALPLVRSLS